MDSPYHGVTLPFNDPTEKHLSRLQPRTAAVALAFINAMREAGIPAYISSSTRTQAEQDALVARGLSQTRNSRHLSGQAFDIDILGYGRDEIAKSWWLAVGEYAEAMGMTWGGRFKSFYDAGHFEFK